MPCSTRSRTWSTRAGSRPRGRASRSFKRSWPRRPRSAAASWIKEAVAAVLRSHAAGDEGHAGIPDRATFERLSFQGDDGLIEPRLRGVEYVKFWISGTDGNRPKIHFMNTEVFRSHRVAMRAAGMKAGHGGGGGKVSDMLGSLCYRPFLTAPDGARGLYTLEFDPNDAFSFAMVKLAWDQVVERAPFLSKRLAYHPLPRAVEIYERQKKLYRDAGIPIFLAEDTYGDIVLLPLNRGVGYGRLRKMAPGERPSPRDIVLYPTLPNEMLRVAGIITCERQTPLSHVNLRAVQDRVPNAFIRHADEDAAIAALIGKYVRYEVSGAGYTLREVTAADVEKHFDAMRPKQVRVPERDLTVKRIRPLDEIAFADSSSVGVKAANLGALRKLGFPDGTVPDGFAVPFSFYDEFMRHNGLYDRAKKMRAAPGFRDDTDLRIKALAELRARIIRGTWPREMQESISSVAKSFSGRTRLRCRSSTNNEDLPGFSGAGLHDSFTAPRPRDDLADTIKRVYASLWNFRAFEEREFHRIDHHAAAMGVLIHPSYRKERANGVAVTDDIVYRSPTRAYYVNVQVDEDMVTNPDDRSTPEELLLSPSKREGRQAGARLEPHGGRGAHSGRESSRAASPPPRPHRAQVPEALRETAVCRRFRDRDRVQDHRRRPARDQASAAVGVLTRTPSGGLHLALCARYPRATRPRTSLRVARCGRAGHDPGSRREPSIAFPARRDLA